MDTSHVQNTAERVHIMYEDRQEFTAVITQTKHVITMDGYMAEGDEAGTLGHAIRVRNNQTKMYSEWYVIKDLREATTDLGYYLTLACTGELTFDRED